VARWIAHQFRAHIQRTDQRGLVLTSPQQTIRPLVRGVEGPVRLEDDG
jgi:ribosomal protein S28E/S33